MAELEAVLARRAQALGVDIRRGAAVSGVDQDADGVTALAGDLAMRGRWLVGCDGARSAVRKAAGVDFAGTEPEFTGYTLQLDLADPEQLGAGRQLTPTGLYFQSQPGFLVLQEFDDGAGHRARDLTREHLERVLRRVSGTGVTVRAVHAAATWTDRARLATRYRTGRVLLAGDAAAAAIGATIPHAVVMAISRGTSRKTNQRRDKPAKQQRRQMRGRCAVTSSCEIPLSRSTLPKPPPAPTINVMPAMGARRVAAEFLDLLAIKPARFPKLQKLNSTAISNATSDVPMKFSRSFGKVFGVEIRSAQLPISIRITGNKMVNSVMPKPGSSRGSPALRESMNCAASGLLLPAA